MEKGFTSDKMTYLKKTLIIVVQPLQGQTNEVCNMERTLYDIIGWKGMKLFHLFTKAIQIYNQILNILGYHLRDSR